MASTYAVLIGLLTTMPAAATPFFFSTGDPDAKMATASRPSTSGKFEIELADDFVLTQSTSLTNATFTGLLTGGATVADIGQVVVEIYRVFPKDSDVGRTSGPPTFSTSNVPTRVNSPSDNEFHDPDMRNINATVLAQTFTAAKSVQPGGIPIPGLTPTGGDGPVVGEEVEFDVDFTAPSYFRPTITSSCRKSRLLLRMANFCGYRRRGRSFRRVHRFLQASRTCRVGPAMNSLTPIGYGSAPTSSVAVRRRHSTPHFHSPVPSRNLPAGLCSGQRLRDWG